MIYLNLHGQLGNQMFQYAFARALQKETKDDIIISYYCVEKMGWKGNLHLFNIKKCKFENDSNFLKNKTDLQQKILGGFVFFMLRLFKTKRMIHIRVKLQLMLQPILNRKGLYWLDAGFYKPIVVDGNKVINGQYENPNYFNNVRDELIEEFVPVKKLNLSPINERIMKTIRECEAVCVSIRRGDFLDPDNKKYYYLCTPEYFDKAIKKIKEKVEKPRFFVFSNDIEWVKKNISFDENTIFEESTNTVMETFELMKSCKHYIISNSTFHWWAQYLSTAAQDVGKEKIVVAPSRWSNAKLPYGLIDDKWIKIEV